MDRWTIYGVLKACREGRENRALKEPYLKIVQSEISIKDIEEMNLVEVKEGLLEFLTTVAFINKDNPTEREDKLFTAKDVMDKTMESIRRE
ncbi:hypothetical protein [Clostridium baratii]|uniref:hypothetical protein n=1 Tax=Clostridium baratii TaxID=1561 RepID=UPI0030D10BC1